MTNMSEETKITTEGAIPPKRAVIKRLRVRKETTPSGALNELAVDERQMKETIINGSQSENFRDEYPPLRGTEDPMAMRNRLKTIPQTKRLALASGTRGVSEKLIPGEYQTQSIAWMIKQVVEAFLTRIHTGPVHSSSQSNRDLIKERIIQRHKEWKVVIHRMIALAKMAEEEMNRTFINHIPSDTLIEKLIPEEDVVPPDSRLSEHEKDRLRRQHRRDIINSVVHHEAFQSENHTPIIKSIAYTMIDMIISFVVIEHTVPLEIEIRAFEINFESYCKFLGEILRKIEKAKCERQKLMEELPTTQIHLGRLSIRCKALSSELRDDKSKKSHEEKASDAEELRQVATEMKRCLELKIQLEDRDTQLIDLIHRCRTAIVQTPSDLLLGDGTSPSPIVMTKYFCLPDYYPEMDAKLYDIVTSH